MKPANLNLLTSVSTPTVHPLGTIAIAAITHPSLEADAQVGQLWHIPLNKKDKPQRFTRGFHDTAPQFSPDGTLLAFLRTAPQGAPQLHVVNTNGGEPVKITDRPLGISEFLWAPDGRSLAFVSRTPEAGRYGSVAGIGPDAEPARRIRTAKYQENGIGYVTDRRAHIFLVPTPDVWSEPAVTPVPNPDGTIDAAPTVPEATQLTRGDWDDSAIAFSLDGKTLAFVSARHDGRDHDLCSNVFLVPIDGSTQPVEITGKYGKFSVESVRYRNDGVITFTAQNMGESGRDFVARNSALYAFDNSDASPRILTDPETVDFTESSIVAYRESSVLVRNRHRASYLLTEVASDGTLHQLTDEPIVVVGAGVGGDTIVMGFANASTSGDIAVIRPDGPRQLTDFSRELRANGIVTPTELNIPARDGYPVHGWVLTPEGEGPHPVLLNIHGGPFYLYTGALFDEAQVYVDAGYAVVMCNPRGSATYGQEHGRIIRQRMGTVDMTDVLDFFDGVLAQTPTLDKARVGVMGGSYGGYLTAWTIAHDHRFAAAIVERAFLDPEYFIGTSDIGGSFSDEYTGIDPEQMRAQSPQAVVGQVRTPALVLHSNNDLRCPLGQAERYYAALKRNGVETELVIFPGEDHELSRSGRPRHRLERFEIILDWWQRHLPVKR
ncbi:S9 family peptidase [Lysinibacter sp. HNR]|uniref:S9 family peptidase n=1 Tax=Lysinibacter sp. HNR TaxID=3031408 RepID=UPI0024354D80|nr:S9 family peptidase [Lysinibacter sp. HNR]WGD37379.1 S9 family peptidase [Lysinibacter sp. HNR]